MKESKSMMKKEVAFMKKKGAPKSMIKHEMKEAGVKKMAFGGMGVSQPRMTSAQVAASGAARRQELAAKSAAAKERAAAARQTYADTRARVAANKAARNPMQAPNAPASVAGSAMPSGSMMDRIKASGAARFKKGGMTSSYRKAADGIASKGKTKAKMVKMRYGGAC